MQQRFVVVGAGGVAGWLCDGLAHYLEYRRPGTAMFIVDGDTFEPKNKERQNFVQFGNKANVRAAELQPRFPSTVIVPVPAWVVAADDPRLGTTEDGDAGKVSVESLLEEHDVVYAIVDNFATRKLIFDAAHRLDNIDVISAGNDDDLFASAYIYRRRNGVDVTDHPIVMHKAEYLNPPDRNPGAMSCSERAKIDGGHQLLVANFAAANLALMVTHRYIFEDETLEDTGEYYLDLRAMTASSANRMADNESIAMVNDLLNPQGVLS